MVIVDTISIADRLQRAGMEEAIAKAVAKEVLVGRGDLATKEDLDALKVYIGHIETSLKSEMDIRFDNVYQRFDTMEEKTDIRFESVDKRFDGMDRSFNFLKWLIVISIGSMGIILSALMIFLQL